MKFFYFLGLVLLVASVQGATVINSIYSDSFTPGEAGGFIMILKPDIPAEYGIPLTVGTDGGNCSPWVSVNASTVVLNEKAGVPVKADIQVPKNAFNGNYSCRVEYTAPAAGMIQSIIAVPIKIAITGGRDAPKPTDRPTEAPTEAPVKPTGSPVTMTAPIERTEASAGAPVMPFTTTGLLIAGAVALVFVVVALYDYRRGMKR